jgi:fumarylacetoacetase
VLVLRARRGARSVGDPLSFGAGPNGLLWRDGGDAVDLAGLGGVFAQSTLNPLLAEGRAAWEEAIAAARDHDGPRSQLSDAALHLPFEVADYVDFYSSLEHATNLGRMFRPDQEPLLPNWRWLPVAYHGRAGSVVVSGTDVVRPRGQRKTPDEDAPAFGPSRRLDFELELGFVVGVSSKLGEPVPVEDFADHVFGVVLVNDWSARDIQAWEYVPLGPNLGKSFQTSISAWVTPLALLEGARVEAPPQDPPPLPHLAGGRDWGLDVTLEVELNGEPLSHGNARTLYWTLPQQLAHATSNGASLRTGDLMASGTISGSDSGSEGSMIELFRGHRFLEDGDELVLRGRAPNGVELGEVRGRVLPARA